MADATMYLLESSALSALLYMVYVTVLSRETFFNLNRFFLLGVVVFSLTLPLVNFDFNPSHVVVERPILEVSKFRMSYYEAMVSWELESFNAATAKRSNLSGDTGAPGKPFKFLIIGILTLYAIGVIFCFSRICWTLRWIRTAIANSHCVKNGQATVVKLSKPIAPFSFFKYVFVHEALVDTPEFDHILAHESVHIQQRHSIDLIFVQFLAALFWFNPVIWQLSKSLKTTHEYIADEKIIKSGYSLVEYQRILLSQLISNNSLGLVHNFNLSFIKKRITMMKNRKSGWTGKLKVSATIISTIACCAFIIQCNTRMDEQLSANSGNKSTQAMVNGIDLPVVPEPLYTFPLDPADALNVSIANDKITIDGVVYNSDELALMIKTSGIPSEKGHTVMNVHKDQKMALVRKVEYVLRQSNRRKIVYVGKTSTGAKVESAIVLPPPLNEEQWPDPEALHAAGRLDLLKINVGDNGGHSNQKRVYDFVQSHMQKKSTDYVVSTKYNDDDIYNDYLVNLIYIKEGFHQIYQERANTMFGKNYSDVSKEEYKLVREGVPMAISIAEK